MPGAAVRVLHPGFRDIGGRAFGAAPESDRPGSRRRNQRQPVPLHRLRIDQAGGGSGGRAFEEMTTRWFGARVQRVEDDRLLRGHGRFTDDIDEGALESCIVRSPFAHARIRSIDVTAARAMPGVAAVYTAADLPFGQTDLPVLIPHPNLTQARTQRCLASEVVRYVGEAVAFIVAESRSLAEDAAEAVQVEYEPLPVVITPESAARADHLVHEDVPDNVAAEMIQEGGSGQAALAWAPRRKRLHLRFERGAASPMEARAGGAAWANA